jgi:hypothetical protein
MPPQTPTETDNLLSAIRAQLALVHTSLPGTIASYDEATQTATITPAVKFKYRKADGTIENYAPPAIPGVPIAFPGGDGWSITWPIAAGDPVTLVFAERSLDEWRTAKGSAHEARDVRRFDLTDAIAIPGGRSPADALPAEAYDSAALVIRGTLIKLGSSAASDFVALAALVKSELESIRADVAAHTHPVPGVTAGSGSTTSSPPAGFSTSVGDVAATTTQAE